MQKHKTRQCFPSVLLTGSALIFEDPTFFEHHEVKEKINFSNPPINNFFPALNHTGTLRKYQMYGIAWLESRIEHGGGIIGDFIGLGRVRHFVICRLVTNR